jgi:hypothetical protein
MDFKDLINTSLKFYDEQNEKYKKYIVNTLIKLEKSKNIIEIVDKDDNTLLESKYEILGIYDNQTNIWFWAWLLTFLSANETVISRKLLDYGLKLEPATNNNEHYYIKSQLLNSRITIEDMIELDIHLALSSYLIKDLYSFIKPLTVFLDKDKTKYITYYYLIK